MGIVRLGCRSTTGQLLGRGIGQGSGRAKRTLTSIRDGEIRPRSFWADAGQGPGDAHLGGTWGSAVQVVEPLSVVGSLFLSRVMHVDPSKKSRLSIDPQGGIPRKATTHVHALSLRAYAPRYTFSPQFHGGTCTHLQKLLEFRPTMRLRNELRAFWQGSPTRLLTAGS